MNETTEHQQKIDRKRVGSLKIDKCLAKLRGKKIEREREGQEGDGCFLRQDDRSVWSESTALSMTPFHPFSESLQSM